MRKLYLLCLLLISCFISFAQDLRMVAIGSSTTGGSGAFPADSAWVNRFNYYYKYQLGIVDSTYKYGVGGYSCYKGMPSGYTPPANRPGPDPNNNITKAVSELSDLANPVNGVIIVNYPSNGYDSMSIAEIMFCYQTIYDVAVAAGHRCYITTTQPRSDGTFGTSAIKRKMADIKDSVINRFGVENTLNFWDGLYNPADTTIHPDYSAGDNIHFNNAGHRVLFERVVAKNIFAAALPVTIQSFSGILKDKQVMLQWTAYHDDPNSYFTIQRSSNGVEFQSLQQVNVKEGNGAKQYSYTDPSPLPGTGYYRLSVHEPGNHYFSKTIAIKNIIAPVIIKRLYPVPARQSVMLEILTAEASTATFDIINSSGIRLKRLTQHLLQGENIIALPVAQLPAGNYFVQIQFPGSEPVIQAFTK